MEKEKNKCDELEEKAKALLLLKDGLGAFYAEQKNLLIDQALKLPLTEAATALQKFVHITFISPQELASLTTRLLSGGSISAVASPLQDKGKEKVQEESTGNQLNETPIWNGIKMDKGTKLREISNTLGVTLSLPEETIVALFDSLRNGASVETVDQFLDLEQSDKQFGVLDDLLTDAAQHNLFADIARKLREALPDVFAEKSKRQAEAAGLQTSIIQRESLRVQQLAQTYHLWCSDAQILFVPIGDQVHFFSAIEVDEKESAGRTTNSGSHVIFCLDVSSSMNHDEKGSYQPPSSVDHPASSIKKARDLIPPLFMAALKNGASVTLIVWNSRVGRPIELTPEMFYTKTTANGEGEESEQEVSSSGNTNEFIPDDQMERELRNKTGETVFRASGGTNIEAALSAVGKKIDALSSQVSNIVVWFLTDGEETRYQLPSGEFAQIPSNPAEKQWAYFNSPDDTGLTPYQRFMVKQLRDTLNHTSKDDDDKRRRAAVEFHVCHFGEAHPLFLKALREASGGYFHAIADLDKLRKEMLATASGTNSKISVVGPISQKEHQVPASLSSAEGILYARGQLPVEFLSDEVVTGKNVILQDDAGVYMSWVPVKEAMFLLTILNLREEWHRSSPLNQSLRRSSKTSPKTSLQPNFCEPLRSYATSERHAVMQLLQ